MKQTFAALLLWAVAAFAAMGCFSNRAIAQNESGPLGLSWSSSSNEIRALGVTLSKIDLADYGITFSASNLPKTLADVGNVYLSFGHDDRLWRVAIVSREFERDGSGNQVMARYEELKAILAKLYGPAHTFENLSADDFYSRPDNFVYGIYQHENSWGVSFENKELGVELSIGASAMADAFWRIVYENKSGAEAFHTQHATSEAGAL